jgi:pimeloyl-ACP methyl ester carboxylesterase
MALDTSSLPSYLNSLNLTKPVNTRIGQFVAGPPPGVLEVVLRLGLGALVFNTARNRSLMENLGLAPDVLHKMAQRLRARSMWQPVLEELALPEINLAKALAKRGEHETAAQKIRAALMMLLMGIYGDGYYFYTPMRERGRLIPQVQRVCALLRKISGGRVRRLPVVSARGTNTVGLLHLPKHYAKPAAKSLPVLLAFHPLGGEKDSFDFCLDLFREAGYATFCIDLPAHGENVDGPRLKPEVEDLGLAALEVLAAHPEIDPQRLGVIGGSLGGLFALRTAAASSRVKACLAYASPFDITDGMKQMLPGVRDCFNWVVGAKTEAEAYEAVQGFHLRDVLEEIACPVCLVHGTQDHLCKFTATYEIASRVTAPIQVLPLIDVDHEAAHPAIPARANPGVEWRTQNL